MSDKDLKENVQQSADKIEGPKHKVRNQKVAEDAVSGITPRKEKAPSEMYRLGMLTTPRISVDYLSLYASNFPKPKRIENDTPIFATDADRDYAENFTAGMGFYTPAAMMDDALEREDSEWGNGIRIDEKTTIKPRSHAKSSSKASGLLRRIRNTGAPVTLFLPSTGIYVTFAAPTEADYCDYDMQQAMETSTVGLQTYGLLLNASSGVYLKGMVEFALRYAIATTYDCEGGDIPQTLLSVIKQADYGMVLMGPTMAKFPAGIPWTLLCPDGACGHGEEVNLNIARCLRHDNNAFTPKQRQFMVDNRKNDSVTAEMLKAYQDEFRVTASATHVAEYDEGTATFELQHTDLHTYFTKTLEWVEELNTATTEALGNRATEHERESHIRQRNEARRLTRYAHMVKAVTVSTVDDEGEPLTARETDPAEIIEILAELTSDRDLVNKFEAAIRKFSADNTHTVLGYMASRCPKCGNTNTDMEDDGPFRGIVPISPDKVFLVLSQSISTLQGLLSDHSE